MIPRFWHKPLERSMVAQLNTESPMEVTEKGQVPGESC